MFKYITFVLIILIGFSSQPLKANDGVQKTGEDEKPTFKRKDVSTFPSWVFDQMVHANVPFNVNLRDTDQCLSKIVYLDTSVSTICLSTEFTLTRKGKVTNCKILDCPNEVLIDEVERIILISKDWKAAKRQGEKIDSHQKLDIPIRLEGNVGLLDEEPLFGKGERFNYGKGLNINRYICSIANAIYGTHRSEDRDFETGKITDIHYSISGTLELSFIINKDGYFSNLESKHDLFPVNYGWFVEIHSSSVFMLGFFNQEVKWCPAVMNGHPVSVKVKAFFDYDKREYSWSCYLVND